MVRFWLKFLGWTLTLIVTVLLIVGGGVAYLLYDYGKELPDYTQLAEYDPPVVSRLYAADGRLLEEYAKENRLFVPIAAIPRHVVQAFIAAEDQNFYRHPGIDMMSILRAVIKNIENISQHRSLVGGSTITQQVVKNFLLTNEKSFARKIKEAILSFRISQAYSKDRILELYLNQIYLGNGSYGVASAAVNYFNKSMEELTVEEVAFLAALPKAPSVYDPKRNYDRAKERRDWVIARMLDEQFITPNMALEAMDKPILLRQRDKAEVVKADVFAEAVRREIVTRYGNNTLYEKGLVVHTTLDPQYQRWAEQAFAKGLEAYDRRHGYRGAFATLPTLDHWQSALVHLKPSTPLENWKVAVVLELHKHHATIGFEDGKKASLPLNELRFAKANVTTPADVLKVRDIIYVEALTDKTYGLRQIPEVSGGLIVMDPHTGRVLAMVGGHPLEENHFNRAIQAKRQPGSAFKPFVYQASLENGYTPASIILDGPIEISQGPGLPLWRPKNYQGDFWGPTTLRRGLEKSRNTMTVRLAQMLGIKKIIEVTKRMEIHPEPPRNFSIVLGATETSLIQLTNAYSMFVNGGKRVRPALIERIQDRQGKTLFRRDSRICEECRVIDDIQLSSVMPPELKDIREKVVDPRVAYQMVSLLEGVVQRGTGAAAKRLGYTLGGKTGTTNDSFDTWFIGFSPDLVVGTYVGYDNPRSLGKRETGASVTLPIFIHFMELALKDKPNVPFRVPSGIKLVRIDGMTGQLASPETPAKQLILEAFKVGTEPQSLPPPESDPMLSVPKESAPSPAPIVPLPSEGTGGIY